MTEPVARPVFALEVPQSMSKLVRVARALKVLHGPDLRMHERGWRFVWYTAGEPCGCQRCDTYLRELAQADYMDIPGGMILCSTCGNKRCPHATDHDEDCTGSNKPGQPGSSYQAMPGPPPPEGSIREYLDRRRDRWP